MSVARRGSTVASMVLLLAVGTACTGGAEEPAATPPPSRSTGSTATLDARPAPLDVRVTRVAGKLPKRARPVLERRLGKVVGAYFDDAFLGGDYPRSDFGNAFATFTASAAEQAHRDRRLTTNLALGPTTESVRPTRRAVWLAVLAPGRVAAGASARFELDYVADRGDRQAKQVRVTGRLLLTRTDNGWRVFGYRVARSVKDVA
jgi:hypothetical protein